MARVSSKHQVTLPVESTQKAHDLEQALGIFDGIYEPGYLERLRSGERVRRALPKVGLELAPQLSGGRAS